MTTSQRASAAVRGLLAVVLATLVGFAIYAPTSTTAASAATFTYDIPANARVSIHEFEAAGTSPAHLSATQEGSASLAAEGRGTSTTPSTTLVATEAASAGPRVGGGASLDNLTPGEMSRIQNAANKVDQPISVVGSRASGTAGPYSDWDYVVPGASSSTVGKIKNSLPEGPRGIGDPRNIDIFRGQVNEDLPFITFNPTPR